MGFGCNLTEYPGIETFAAVLATVQERPDVQDVLVGITDLNDTVSDSWPFSDRVYIISSATLGQVKNWLQPLSPDDVLEVAGHETASEQQLLHPDSGYKVYLVWWD